MKTVAWKVADTESNINSQLKNKGNDFEWFFLALDEFLFIRGINADIEITGELISMNSLPETTTERNIFIENIPVQS